MRHLLLTLLLVGSLVLAPLTLADDGLALPSMFEWMVQAWEQLAEIFDPPKHGPFGEPGGEKHGPFIEPGGLDQCLPSVLPCEEETSSNQ